MEHDFQNNEIVIPGLIIAVGVIVYWFAKPLSRFSQSTIFLTSWPEIGLKILGILFITVGVFKLLIVMFGDQINDNIK